MASRRSPPAPARRGQRRRQRHQESEPPIEPVGLDCDAIESPPRGSGDDLRDSATAAAAAVAGALDPRLVARVAGRLRTLQQQHKDNDEEGDLWVHLYHVPGDLLDYLHAGHLDSDWQTWSAFRTRLLLANDKQALLMSEGPIHNEVTAWFDNHLSSWLGDMGLLGEYHALHEVSVPIAPGLQRRADVLWRSWLTGRAGVAEVAVTQSSPSPSVMQAAADWQRCPEIDVVLRIKTYQGRINLSAWRRHDDQIFVVSSGEALVVPTTGGGVAVVRNDLLLP
ncbi:hypothetical protein KEM52_000024, partial [Ascosphaera acerosa]